MESGERYIVQVYVGAFSAEFEALSVEALKCTSAEEMVACIVDKLHLDAPNNYELAEVVGNSTGQECKERRLDPLEHPVGLMLLWPKVIALEEPTAGILNYRRFSNRSDIDFPDIEYIDAEERIDQQEYRFYLREKLNDANWSDSINADPQLIRDYFYRFLYQPRDREYPDLCQLPDLNEETLLENLRARFHAGHIYTYVGSILIAVNPFKFYPIYNPKYVKLYQNRRLGELPPHIFAVADAAYHAMMRDRRPQCIVISGESGSGKTESTNFLLHHLTALSQKGSHGSGVEQTILNAGPVLEAFGNAKTCHNNNSSRFGKFIQVTYRENGQVHGALVQKYLLEKSRICFQAKNERNYHVFYHLLVGSSSVEKAALHLQPPQSYRYLNQSDYHGVDPDDSCYELSRLKQSMEMVGFSPETQRRVFAVLSAVLHIGNVEFQPRKSTYHHDESVHVKNPEVVTIIANLLKVREEVLHQALISKRARTAGEMLVINYRMPEAIAARDAMAKCLYGSLFDWIVLQVNHALLAKKDPDKIHSAFSIGVLDIFGFEDFGQMNSFEQFCINYANEHLQYYFNQHVFKYEQEEYRREGIHWVNIQFVDNTGCLYLFESKPNGLFCILDDQCNFPGATNETLLQKLHSVNKENDYYEVPQKREAAFIVWHYAGKVKYQVAEFREKNLDLMRADTVAVLKSSQLSFVRELVGADPVAVFRWAILRAFMRAYSAFVDAGKRHRENYAERGHRQKGRFHPDLKKSRLTKNRAHRSSRGWRNLESVKTLAGRLGPGVVPVSQDQRSAVSSVNPAHKNVKKMQTVGAQFQISLQSLLVALNNANPFFVRCIKSNRLKAPNQFDDEIVLRQLRYTGMLETVRIRQAGFNVRLSFDEFIHHYRILLPRGLLSSQADVIEFIESMNLNSENYQIGHEKIFLRESEKAKLDHRLHQTILASIVTIQRWFRTCLERRNFLALRSAVVKLQSYARMFLAQRHAMNLRMRHMAATVIQKVWRGYKVRRWYSTLRESVIGIQARARGNLARQRYEQMKSERRDKEKGDAHSAQSTDEAFLSKGSSQEELDLKEILEQLSSEESSGIQEDSEPESEAKVLAGISVGGVPLQLPALLDDKPSPEAFDKFKSRPLVKSAMLKSDTKDRERETPTEKRPGLPTISTTRIGSIEELLRGQDAKTKEEKSGAIQRAKKHWKSFLGGSKRPEKSDMSEEQDNSDSESTLVSTSASRSTSTLSSFTDLDWDCRSRDREYRREERKRIIAERHPMRSRANSITDEASPHSPTPSGASSAVLHRRFSRDVDSFPLGLAAASLRRGSKEGVRSISIDSSLRGSRDSLRGAANLSRRDSYVSASTASPKEAVSRTSSETGSSAAKPSISEIHKLNRANKFYKGETCTLCQKTMSAFFVQGYKCSECGLIFHSKCVQQGVPNAQALPQAALECVQTGGSPAPSKDRSKRKNNRERGDYTTASENSKWNLTKTSEFTDSVQNVITSVEQLQRLDEFIARKIHQLGNQGGGADRVFLSALRQFKSNLISHYGVAAALKHPGTPLNLSYRDLIENFDKITESVAREEPSFPVTLAVNAFRGFLNEFVASERKQEDKESRDKVKFKRKRHKERAKKNKNRAENEAKQAKIGEDSVVRHLDHEFATLNSVVTIPTACEVCSSFTWLKEKGLVCQGCKLTCHKKCFSRITARCPASGSRSGPTQPVIIDPVHKTSTGGYLFGVALDKLIRSTSHRIPIVIERLITTIELVGLYTEGLYRKSGVSSRVQQLKKLLEDQVASGKSEEDVVDLKEQPVHVLTAVLKSFLREMPQPLLTFERYDDFLRVADIVDVKERTSSLMNLVQELPQPHFDLLERLVFHLTRVALNEKSNRMNANALAIVFAPCILRTSRLQQAQDSLSNVAKQTLVVETILNEQLSRVTEKLANIDTLDTACLDYTSRLGTLRASKLFTASEVRPREAAGNETSPSNEEQLLQQQIDELREEKAALAATLPSLARSPSDEDLLSTDGDIDLDCEDFSNAGGSLDDLRSSTDSSSKVTVSSNAPVYKVIIPVGGPAEEEAPRPEWEKRLYAAQKVFEEQAQFLSQSDEVDSRPTNRRARIQRSTQIPRGTSQSKLEKISVTLNNDGSIVSSYQDVLEVDLDDDAIMV